MLPAATMIRARYALDVVLPPLSVYLRSGLGKRFWLNVLLTLLGYVPGVVHAARLTRASGDEGSSVPV